MSDLKKKYNVDMVEKWKLISIHNLKKIKYCFFD